MNILIILIIVFLCVYLISKFFNFEEIKKYILALIAFFTLTNSTYPIKHGGANENRPTEDRLPSILSLFDNPYIPYVYPHIPRRGIIVDGFNIFILLRERYRDQFIQDYNSENKRNPNYVTIDQYCFEKMITELNRCFDGSIYLVIKTGQDNTLMDCVNHCRAQRTMPANVTIYNAFYNDINQDWSNIEIGRLSIKPNKSQEEKDELHRLKSLDDHMLMVIANGNPGFTIISRDKYREIRINREIPNVYTIQACRNNIITDTLIIDPRTVLLRNLFTHGRLSQRIIVPIINRYGEIIMFAKYINRYFDYAHDQDFMINNHFSEITKNFYDLYTLLLDNIVEKGNLELGKPYPAEVVANLDNEKVRIINVFTQLCTTKLRDLTDINKIEEFQECVRPDNKEIPPFPSACIRIINALKQRFDIIKGKTFVEIADYDLLPNRETVMSKHQLTLQKQQTFQSRYNNTGVLVRLRSEIQASAQRLIEVETRLKDDEERRLAEAENRRLEEAELRRLEEKTESQAQINDGDFPFNRMSIAASQSTIPPTPSAPIPPTPSAHIKPRGSPVKPRQIYQHPNRR